MRSLNKGRVPVLADGSVIVFGYYQHAWPHLVERLGRYCAYCERTIPANLAVEHKLPKTSHGHLERAWSNLLLACSNCNSSKLAKLFVMCPPLWPDEDDTFALTEYRPSGAVAARSTLPPPLQSRVTELLQLVGLTKTPAQAGTDHRFADRLEVWRKAQQCAADLLAEDSQALRRATVEVAKSSGGFSIWRTVFAHDADMTCRLIEAFPGTRTTDPA